MDQGYSTQGDRPARSTLPNDGESAPSLGIISRVRRSPAVPKMVAFLFRRMGPICPIGLMRPKVADTPPALDVGWVAHARRSFAATGRIRRGRPLFPPASARRRSPAAGMG